MQNPHKFHKSIHDTRFLFCSCMRVWFQLLWYDFKQELLNLVQFLDNFIKRWWWRRREPSAGCEPWGCEEPGYLGWVASLWFLMVIASWVKVSWSLLPNYILCEVECFTRRNYTDETSEIGVSGFGASHLWKCDDQLCHQAKQRAPTFSSSSAFLDHKGRKQSMF